MMELSNTESAIQFVLDSFSRRAFPGLGEEVLAKNLNMFDVTFLGVGATVGVGSLIFVGEYSLVIGPAFVLTNLLTAGVILASAICYSDFIRRVNTCGGAYSAAYHEIGEMRAAFLGCLLSIEHISASALAARGLSQLLDRLFFKWFSNNLKAYMSFNSPFFHIHPDVLGTIICICSSGLVSFNVKKVSAINNFCCFINLGLFVLITLVSGSNLNFQNWNLPPSEVCGNGGFLPFGLGSVFRGMSKVYASYIGFDSVANAASEVRDPHRVIPLSMTVAVIILTVLFTLNSFTYTLVWSYCDQDLDDPIPKIMEQIGLDIMKWITSIGLPITMLGNLICNTYPLSRLIYAMAEDGLLCTYLAKVDRNKKSPLHALYTSVIFTALCVLFYSTWQLSELSSLGAISAYNVITYSLIYICYTDEKMEYGDTNRPILNIIFNRKGTKQNQPTVISSSIVRICCWVIFTTAFPYFYVLKSGFTLVLQGDALAILSYVGFFVLYGSIIYIIKRQPLSVDAPCKKSTVPTIHVLLILINTYLVLEFDICTWINGAAWLLVGAIVYLTYGIWNSKAKRQSVFI